MTTFTADELIALFLRQINVTSDLDGAETTLGELTKLRGDDDEDVTIAVAILRHARERAAKREGPLY